MKQPVQLIMRPAWVWAFRHGFSAWQWIDKDGRKVFSDQAPPADIAEKTFSSGLEKLQNLRRPRCGPTTAKAGEPYRPSQNALGNPIKIWKPKKQMAQAEINAKQNKRLGPNADNCMRARQTQNQPLNLGSQIDGRMPAGRREIMDDAARQRDATHRSHHCSGLRAAPKPAQ